MLYHVIVYHICPSWVEVLSRHWKQIQDIHPKLLTDSAFHTVLSALALLGPHTGLICPGQAGQGLPFCLCLPCMHG